MRLQRPGCHKALPMQYPGHMPCSRWCGKMARAHQWIAREPCLHSVFLGSQERTLQRLHDRLRARAAAGERGRLLGESLQLLLQHRLAH